MKRSLQLLLLAPMAFSAVGCTQQKAKKEGTPVDVVLISGQSNAVGCTHSDCISSSISMEAYEEYMIGYKGIQIAHDCWTKDWPEPNKVTFYSQNTSKKNSFVKVTLGQGNSLETFGPEIGIAQTLHEKYDKKLFLIKFACGGSNLKDDWLKRNSPMYPKFIDYVKLQMNNLVDMGYKPTIKAFCWMQGEGDSYPGYSSVYQENLREFVGNVRNDLKDLGREEGIPFIDAGISSASVWQNYKEVNEAKAAFAEESDLNFYIDTIAAGLHTDQEPFFNVDECHYDSESEVLLGKLFAQAFEPFLAK